MEEQASGLGGEGSPSWSAIRREPTGESEDMSSPADLALVSWPNTLPAWLERRAPSDMLPGSVYLLRLFPGLASFLKDLNQGQEDGHSHGQEEGNVDSKLLVVGEIQEVEEGGVKKRRARRRSRLPGWQQRRTTGAQGLRPLLPSGRQPQPYIPQKPHHP